MAAAAVISNQSVVDRVTSLPLVISTYGLVSSVYSNTKDTHPYLKSVCEAAEQGVRTITSVAFTTASPIIDKLEPQIAIANDLACKGLDKIEKTLPILHQPSEQMKGPLDNVMDHLVNNTPLNWLVGPFYSRMALEPPHTPASRASSSSSAYAQSQRQEPMEIVSSAKDVVTTATGAVTERVSGAKDSVSGTLSSVRGAVYDGMDKTRAAVSGSVSTVLVNTVARMVSIGVGSALSTSESLVEQYLPLTEDELELEAETATGFDREEASYYVRLGSLSTKLRKRAYTRAMAKIRDRKQRSVQFISELNSTVDLIEYGRRNIDGANQMVNNKLNSQSVLKSNGPNQHNGYEAEAIESRTLTLARSLTQQLQTTCLGLVSGLQGLPLHIQQEALSLSCSASQVYSSFSAASTLRELPDSVLSTSRVQLGRMKDSLDKVMDYLVNNTPLNWLVGPFYSRMAPEPPHTPASSASSSSSAYAQSQRQKPMEVEMESLQSHQR
ncbi:perilipin-2 isoform X1 [Trematomus bernacchii]|uniref:perilipin-2 isoform X1 n=1 Tax=Trematomus bernacchii TaxID=40690 RepID=UPI00146B3FB1|nr:perilipin-2 isoform X1 [Trematomus bernacchii]